MGRTPGSARDALVPLFYRRIRRLPPPLSRPGAGCGRRRPPHHLCRWAELRKLRADARITSHLDDWRTWRTHSCVPRRHFCRRPLLQGAEASSETRRGTQECVRHGSRLRSYFCVVPKWHCAPMGAPLYEERVTRKRALNYALPYTASGCCLPHWRQSPA